MKIDEIALLFLEWANEIRMKRKRITLMDLKDFLLDLTDGDEEKASEILKTWHQEK